jgi:hypothetical protein
MEFFAGRKLAFVVDVYTILNGVVELDCHSRCSLKQKPHGQHFDCGALETPAASSACSAASRALRLFKLSRRRTPLTVARRRFRWSPALAAQPFDIIDNRQSAGTADAAGMTDPQSRPTYIPLSTVAA